MKEIIRTTLAATGNSITIDSDTGRVRVLNESLLRSHGIDSLVYLAVFGAEDRQAAARWLIWETAQTLRIRPASIHDLYVGRGLDRLSHTFTTPAMNLRMMSYDMARAAFKAAIKAHVGAFMFELSRSEMVYTDQRPAEYTSVILAAAIKEGFSGPVFLQGDHYQVNAREYVTRTDAELSGLRNLIHESIRAGFYNIELDTSTLVNDSAATVAEQQRSNYELCALLSDHIRKQQPQEIVVSIGGEIGEISAHNSDIHELRAFMEGYRKRIRHTPGLSKLSVRVGTTTGGVVLPNGAIATLAVDFERLKELSTIARREYTLGGAVQHGASTLPQDAFHKFVTAGAIEVHLATAFQNLLFELLSADLVAEIRAWVFDNKASERKPGDNDEQFFYKTRRLACGAFKKPLWNLPDSDRTYIRSVFEDRFALLYRQLGVENTAEMVGNIVRAAEVHKRVQDFSDQDLGVDAGREPAEA